MGDGGSNGDPGTGKTAEYDSPETRSLITLTTQTIKNKLRT